ncbi:MAG TPA: hypothetical protein VHJ38_09775 [Nitrososphaeraceae archaeon]|jgi:hypothetical protein|nr:hypothetical protein [Nitrososphaeraceae archaeon]HSF00091.1 hypothetical protein [Nitrososphaeraceae archaeon]
MNKNKKLVGGQIVGIGSDFLVIQKDGKRFLIEVNFESLNELKMSTTPYGSQI